MSKVRPAQERQAWRHGNVTGLRQEIIGSIESDTPLSEGLTRGLPGAIGGLFWRLLKGL